MELYTTQQVSKKTGMARSTVQKYALQYNIGQIVGMDRLFTPDDIQKIKNIYDNSPKSGRPPLHPKADRISH